MRIFHEVIKSRWTSYCRQCGELTTGFAYPDPRDIRFFFLPCGHPSTINDDSRLTEQEIAAVLLQLP